MKKLVTSSLLWLILWQFAMAQVNTKEEKKLYKLIMELREEHDLPEIPLSRSLTFVAQLHAEDLATNFPAQGECNLHSWSDQGDWKACCYTRDHKQSRCMWDKPKELTSYKGNGYEIAYRTGKEAKAENALEGWKRSSGHLSVILNKNIWKYHTWQAIGIGIYEGYAVVWFGRFPDDGE